MSRISTYMVGFMLICSRGGAAGQPLALEAHIYQLQQVERLPLIVKLTLRNVGQDPIRTFFSKEDPDLLLRRSALIAHAGENTYRLDYTGGPRRSETVPEAIYVLKAGEAIEVDRVLSPVVRTPPNEWSGKHDDLYTFLEPASYTGHVEVALLAGEKCVSNDITFSVLAPRGTDAEARDRIRFRHVDFLEGRDPAAKKSDYGGGKTQHGGDLTRFKEIQDILEKYPDSTYARWIRFWKVYHHGSDEEALEYARTHRDFPLSDNLMLRVINRVADDDARHNKAIELLAELQRIFPDGDTVDRAKALEEKLLSKKGRP